MSAPPFPQSRLAAVHIGLQAAMDPLPATMAEMGRALWQRLPPEQWALEWSLPIWLGDAFDLAPDVSEIMALGNVLGLGYVRLQDDLLDGRITPADREPAQSLSGYLLQQALRQYGLLMDGDQLFWPALDEILAQWALAQAESNDGPAVPFREWQASDFLWLARRGAPLHIAALATCSLGQRQDTLPILHSALDEILVAAVLLDHVQDWAQDLASGRYNTFVAHASPLRQTPAHAEENKCKVQELIHLGDAGQSYFDTASHFIDTARTQVQRFCCAPLDDYLSWMQSEIVDCHRTLADNARARLRAVTDSVFRAPPAPISTFSSQVSRS